VKTATGTQRHQLALEIDDEIHQPGESLRLDQEIHHAVLETAQQRVYREPAEVQRGQSVAVLTLVEKRRQPGHTRVLAHRWVPVAIGCRPIGQMRRGRVPHRAVVEFFQVIAPFVVARVISLLVERQMVYHHVALGLVAIDKPERNSRRMLESNGLVDDLLARGHACHNWQRCGGCGTSISSRAAVVAVSGPPSTIPKAGDVPSHESGNIGKILDSLALPSRRLAPRFDLPSQGVLQ